MLKTLALAALLCAPVLADDQLITGNGAKTRVTLEDRSDDLRISGSGNVITLTGHGDTLHVAGDSNQIEVDADLSDINLLGSGNKVTFRLRPGRPKPDVTNLGKNNDVQFVEGK